MNPSSDPLALPRRLTPEELGIEAPKKEAEPARKARPRKNRRGRFEVLNGFVDASMAECTPSESVVWLVLYRDARNGVANTAQAWIAKRAGLTERTVRRALVGLQRHGLVDVLRKGGPSVGASLYRVRASR